MECQLKADARTDGSGTLLTDFTTSTSFEYFQIQGNRYGHNVPQVSEAHKCAHLPSLSNLKSVVENCATKDENACA